ncbi:Catalyzes the transfer of a two-carbon ketol group from a ketose donor to an aldose acceptor [Vibrio sp. B1FLJ16]|uniref:transketolase n=1 Tax=Vibrio sp. B1FLJ16 TaxID=2751178 RepID=UPI0015F56726|nr:transketolase [Vibrio sp. B1FLJ16]CAD7818657.1 Catalyzes the transfer of a two-carbon ketol group from a ketose donor to an aldose acceptor [Vibrio sp. B1FLJ16]CAE6935605.1 Catalyzes the transfer of a two-carbon ketol group from a ketose donor to an aldose acceptor [Vibrio sp. B1FLJ16]
MDRKYLANAIRALSMDGVQQANSGHPGAPMGMADIAEVLWRSHLNHNPTNPEWADRDRFVLSNGHGSMLIYSLLHLAGYELSIDDLKNFRQLHSKTPGHPEYGYAPGIETTTGPLGQGITNAVGMAMAEKALAAQFNKEGHDIVDHFTYAFMGDGCLMEGISHEACSLAGTLGLGKLIAFWDDNGISIDGHVEGWFSDDTPKRFEAYGWHVIPAVDGHDSAAINAAIEAAKADPRPTLICTKTIIGFGSPNKSGSHDCHGAPLGAEEIAATRKELGWEHGPFEIPQEVYAEWSAKEAGAAKEAAWNEKFAAYEAAYPELAAEFKRRVNGELPAQWEEKASQIIADLQANPANIASRKASQNALEAFGALLPEFMGGSADLAPSNLTMWSGSKSLEATDFSGNYIHYGVREFGMTAIMNGIALHGGFVPYGATFLMFMEYARNAMRMAALMKIQNIQVYTHDSIGLGEDGPTHQPVEQMASLRLTPNMSTWRPCDQVESAVAWKLAIERKDAPTALIFSRQNLAQQERTAEQVADIAKGAYILKDCEGKPELILIATGSEVELAVEAAAQLTAEGKKVRVVSMPSTDAFDKQDAAYREAVLPSDVTARIAIEAGIADFWYKYVGFGGKIIGMTTFGESAPAGELFKMFGFTTENVVNTAKELLA